MDQSGAGRARDSESSAGGPGRVGSGLARFGGGVGAADKVSRADGMGKADGMGAGGLERVSVSGCTGPRHAGPDWDRVNPVGIM